MPQSWVLSVLISFSFWQADFDIHTLLGKLNVKIEKQKKNAFPLLDNLRKPIYVGILNKDENELRGSKPKVSPLTVSFNPPSHNFNLL